MKPAVGRRETLDSFRKGLDPPAGISIKPIGNIVRPRGANSPLV